MLKGVCCMQAILSAEIQARVGSMQGEYTGERSLTSAATLVRDDREEERSCTWTYAPAGATVDAVPI